jgi:hypothetical protein
MQKIKGRIVYCNESYLVLAKNNKLVKSDNYGITWTVKYKIPLNIIKKIFSKFSLVKRLLREGIHHYLKNNERELVFYGKQIFVLNNEQLEFSSKIQGSRPLIVCATENGFYYGEYKSNPEKSEIQVWYLSNDATNWKSIYTFKGVRHIHGIFEDPFSNQLWITTGDNNDEAAIWNADYKFSYINKILSGSQQSRAVQLLFDKEFVYFGSDAPDEINYLYKMKKNGTDIKRLQEVASSVFFGCKIKDKLYFSTAVEPSEINKTRYSQLWCSSDGDNWKLIYETKKDCLSMKYFQYGQITFPSFQNNESFIYFSPFACQNHEKTIILDA